MRLPIKLICREKKLNSDGTSTVYIQYCYNAKQKTFQHTGIKIPPTYWNNAQRCITNKLPAHHGNHEALNKELRRLFRIAEDLVSHAIEKKMPGNLLKNYRYFQLGPWLENPVHRKEHAVSQFKWHV